MHFNAGTQLLRDFTPYSGYTGCTHTNLKCSHKPCASILSPLPPHSPPKSIDSFAAGSSQRAVWPQNGHLMLDAFWGRSHKPAASKVDRLPTNSHGLRVVSLLGKFTQTSRRTERRTCEGGGACSRCEQQACGAPKMHLGQVAVLGPN